MDVSNSAGPGRNLQVSGAVGVTLWKRELGGDRGDAQGSVSVPPSGGATDHGDDGGTWGRRRVGVSIGRGGDGLHGDPPNRSINQESEGNHSGEGGFPSCLYILHGGGEDDGDDPDGTLVGSRRIK